MFEEADAFGEAFKKSFKTHHKSYPTCWESSEAALTLELFLRESILYVNHDFNESLQNENSR